MDEHRNIWLASSVLDREFLPGRYCQEGYAILFQFPPYWKCDLERLRLFMEELPADKKYVFEFREPSWWNDSVSNLLKDHKMAFCIFNLSGVLSPEIETADFIYLRLHGSDKSYQGCYGEDELQRWADKIKKCTQKQKDVYCYFNNDQEGFAVKNALRLKQILTNIGNFFI